MEPKLPQSAVSQDGYIIDQEQCGVLRYGVWRSDRNGCGWIAVYNFLRATGCGRRMSEIRSGLLNRSLLKGLIGTRMISIYWYLRRCGFRPTVSCGCADIAMRAQSARAGILFYRHKAGWHYVCFVPAGNGAFRFLNAWTGPRDPVQSLDAFVSANAVCRFLLALTVPETRRVKETPDKTYELGGNT